MYLFSSHIKEEPVFSIKQIDVSSWDLTNTHPSSAQVHRKDIRVTDNFSHKRRKSTRQPMSAQFKNQFLLGQSMNVESFVSPTFIGPWQRDKYRGMYIWCGTTSFPFFDHLHYARAFGACLFLRYLLGISLQDYTLKSFFFLTMSAEWSRSSWNQNWMLCFCFCSFVLPCPHSSADILASHAIWRDDKTIGLGSCHSNVMAIKCQLYS